MVTGYFFINRNELKRDLVDCVLPVLDPSKEKCYEAKIEESEKTSSRRELNSGHLACAASALPLSYNYWTTTNPHNPAQVGLNIKCLSCTPGSHSACAVRTLLWVDRKILSIRREHMLSGFLSLNA